MSKTKKLLSIITLVSLIFSSGFAGDVRAASITNAFDRLSDSDKNITNVTHTITFRPNLNLALNDYFQVTLPGEFGVITNSTNVTCPATLSAAVPGAPSRVAKCTSDSGTYTAATSTIVITGVNNPATEGSFKITIASYTSGAVLKESVDVMVAIVQSVIVSANVPSSLLFTVSGVGTSSVINTATTTGSSTANTINFGALVASTTYSSVMGQQLSVTTNASYGYKVTVEQDQNMVSLSGATIDSFQNNAAPVSPIAWTAPTGTLDATTTYGHMGFTTDDATLSSTTPSLYVGNKWMGFTGAGTQEVMYHTGPADGSTQDKGSVKIAYRIQISALQEAGDYTNTLTYVATPTY